jgi:hypothetical protein
MLSSVKNSFQHDSFVRGVLVHEVESVLAFCDDVGLSSLSQDTERALRMPLLMEHPVSSFCALSCEHGVVYCLLDKVEHGTFAKEAHLGFPRVDIDVHFGWREIESENGDWKSSGWGPGSAGLLNREIELPTLNPPAIHDEGDSSSGWSMQRCVTEEPGNTRPNMLLPSEDREEHVRLGDSQNLRGYSREVSITR